MDNLTGNRSKKKRSQRKKTTLKKKRPEFKGGRNKLSELAERGGSGEMRAWGGGFAGEVDHAPDLTKPQKTWGLVLLDALRNQQKKGGCWASSGKGVNLGGIIGIME